MEFYLEKLKAMFLSRRFLLGIAGLLSIFFQDMLGLTEEDANRLIAILAALIGADTFAKMKTPKMEAMMRAGMVLLVALCLCNESSAQHGPGTGTISVGDQAWSIADGKTYLISQTANRVEAGSEFTIELGSGTYPATFTATGTITKHADGRVTVEFKAVDKTKTVYIGGAPDDDGDDPPPQAGLRTLSEQWARTVNDPAVAQELAVTLSVAIAVHDQRPYTMTGAQEAWKLARRSVLSTGALQQKWKPWEDALNAELTRQLQNPGGLDTAAEYVAALAQIRDGLSAYLATLNAAPAIDIVRIIELVQIFVGLIGGEQINLAELLRIILELFRGQRGMVIE